MAKSIERDGREAPKISPANKVVERVLRNFPPEGYLADSDFILLIDPKKQSRNLKSLRYLRLKNVNQTLEKCGDMALNVAEVGKQIYHRTSIEKGQKLAEQIRRNKLAALKSKSKTNLEAETPGILPSVILEEGVQIPVFLQSPLEILYE